MTDAAILDMLNKLAQEISPVASARMAACLTYKGRVISFGINKKKTHPFQKRFALNEHNIYLHAETAAIKNALRYLSLDQLKKSTLYVARIKRPSTWSKEWIFGLAKPCHGCQKCIDQYQISKVRYSVDV